MIIIIITITINNNKFNTLLLKLSFVIYLYPEVPPSSKSVYTLTKKVNYILTDRLINQSNSVACFWDLRKVLSVTSRPKVYV